VSRLSVRGLGAPDPSASDMAFVALRTASAVGSSRRRRRDYTTTAEPASENIGPQGLPLIKPPWGRITAIDLNSGDHLWMIPNGDASDYVKNHPALQGVDLSGVGNRVLATLMVTKALLFGGVGNNLFIGGSGGGSPLFRAFDKSTGDLVHQIELPAATTGVPMTYMANGRQFIAVAVGGRGYPSELVALAVP
jgi:quinoprotein glucose dehydrogenase